MKITNGPYRPGDKQRVVLPDPGSLPLHIAQWVQAHAGLSVVVVPDHERLDSLQQALDFFLAATPYQVLAFPDWETLPYDRFSPHQDIVSARLRALYALPQGSDRLVVLVSIQTLMQRVCPPDFVLAHSFHLAAGDEASLTALRAQLEKGGYRYTPQVLAHGEFSIRGSILDLFPMGSEWPFRVDFLSDTVESIRVFDPDSQKSQNKVERIALLPAHEFPLTETAISQFRVKWRSQFEGDPNRCPVYEAVSEQQLSPGVEYYLPLFFQELATLFDYTPAQTLWIQVGDVVSAADQFWQQIKDRFAQYSGDITHPLLPPQALYLPAEAVFARLKDYAQVLVSQTEAESLPRLATQDAFPEAALREFLAGFTGRVLFCADGPGRQELLSELLARHGLSVPMVASWSAFQTAEVPLAITVAPLERGFVWEGLAVLTEFDLLGRRVLQRRRRQAKTPEGVAYHALFELIPHRPVVHIEHGVGRYVGLTYLEFSGVRGEFLTIEYAGGDRIYVPVTALHVLSPYNGADTDQAPLHRLGSDQWSKAKKKAREAVYDVAAELLDIYARRAAKKGVVFTAPDALFADFCARFPFEETPDQEQAITQVLRDLCSERPMDRIICGDVGFGKTEVALRAACLGILSGYQVALLVPTTLLAQQHYQTFLDRFSGMPVKIEVLSRFKTAKEQADIVQRIAEGRVDIVIGTHKLLQSSLRYKSLGLLIIDEEHRFGVRQKEALKALRTEMHILTLTATPIPRTLNMALSGIRDLSIIATPPAKRLAIKTFVREYQEPLILEAVQRELARGGQVYYLHNSVDTIRRVAGDLQALLPNARVAVAHGQMSERELEGVMSDFYHRRYNLLVCTTIIENGIDIPTANTIIIDRADKLGLAQLHQLRGRVGRSHHQAYAYCLTPTRAAMTADAVKRLQALEELETLGAGFSLASHDLEIRGAGELLGETQSGHLHTIGFSLFMQMLEETVTALKEGRAVSTVGETRPVEIDLRLSALIPDTYIFDVPMRWELYQRLSLVKQADQIDELQVEMIDRFGIPPEPVYNLLAVTRLRLQAEKLGIQRLEMGPEGGKIDFQAQPNIDLNKLLQLVQSQSQHYRFEGAQRLRVKFGFADPKARLKQVSTLLDALV